MLLVILALLTLGLIVFIKLSIKTPKKSYDDLGTHELFIFLSGICGFMLAINLGIIIFLLPQIATSSTIDAKIEMYQEENENIENDIDKIVTAYMEHEKETFNDLKTDENSITLVTLFLELKSDTLV